MKNRKLLLIVSLVLAMTMSLGGTLAYLTDTDADVNTMVLGNVKIAQNEQMRDENGELVEYQDKPALPAVYTSEAWADEKVTISGEEFKFFAPEMKNVNDKIVTVTNMGNTKAFVRTIIAIEAPEGFNDDLVHVNVNDTKGITSSGWSYATTEAGVRYVYTIFTYTDALAAKATSLPSLMQVFLDKDTTNEDVAKLGEEWEIIALSQAVQADGFADAKTALEEAFPFGESKDAAVAAWLADAENHIGTPGEKNETNDVPKFYDYIVTNLEELKAALAKGGSIQLANDIQLDKITAIEPGVEVYLDMNGKTLTVAQDTASNTLLYVKEGAKLVIDGDGTIDLEGVSTMAMFAPYGELVIENGTFIRDKVTTVTNKTTGLFMGCKTTSSNVTINGGYFDPGYYDENAADIEDILAGAKEFVETADDIAKRGNSKDANKVRVALKDNVSALLNHSGYGTFKVYGGTFVGANPAWGDEGCMLPTTPNYLRPWSYYQGALLDGQTFNENGIVLPAGYSITRGTTADGVPTYTVNYSK